MLSSVLLGTTIAVFLHQAQPLQVSLQLVSSCWCVNWAEEDGRCNHWDPTEGEHHKVKMSSNNHCSNVFINIH